MSTRNALNQGPKPPATDRAEAPSEKLSSLVSNKAPSEAGVYAWSVGYAKTGKSTCQVTKERIKAGHVRIGKQIDNPHVAGARTFVWFKPGPLFEQFQKGNSEAPRIKSTSELLNFDTLKKFDAENVETLVRSTAALFAEADAAKEMVEQAVKKDFQEVPLARPDADDENDDQPATWRSLKPAIKPYPRVRLREGPGGVSRIEPEKGEVECAGAAQVVEGLKGALRGHDAAHGDGVNGERPAAMKAPGGEALGARNLCFLAQPRSRDAVLTSVAENSLFLTEEHLQNEEVLLMVSTLSVFRKP